MDSFDLVTAILVLLIITLWSRRSAYFTTVNLIVGLVGQVTLFAGAATLMQYGFLKGGETLATGFILISLLFAISSGYSEGFVVQRTYRREIKPQTKNSTFFKFVMLAVFTMFAIWAGSCIYLSGIDDSVEGPTQAVTVSQLESLSIRFPLASDPSAKAIIEGRLEAESASSHTTSHIETKDLMVLSNEVSNSVLNIKAVACSKLQEDTGFAISDSLILTNAHTIAGAENVRVINSLGNRTTGRVVGFDASRDFALISVNDMDLNPLKFARPQAGPAAAFGYDKDNGLQVVSVRLVERLTANGYDLYGERPTKRKVWLVEGQLRSGFSGGPVINSNGNVVGVTFAVARSAVNTSSATGYILDELEAQAFIFNTDTEKEVDTLDCYR